jgi:hypothetical protein
VTIEFAVIPGKPLKPPCMDIIKRCHLMFKIGLFTNLNR